MTKEEWRIISEELNNEYIRVSNNHNGLSLKKDDPSPTPLMLMVRGVILSLSMVAYRVAERMPDNGTQ